LKKNPLQSQQQVFSKQYSGFFKWVASAGYDLALPVLISLESGLMIFTQPDSKPEYFDSG
jgi:hypothetical protein